MLQAATNLLDVDPPFHIEQNSGTISLHNMFALQAPSPSTLYKYCLATFAVSTGKSSKTEQAAISRTPEVQETPPAILVPKIHPLEPQVTKEVDTYFIEHWPFPNDKAIQKFRDAGFSYVTCCYFPEALPDRIHFGCRLLTILFLIDGIAFSILSELTLLTML